MKFENFGGIIPKLDSSKLPDIAAQTAHGCDVSGGVLKLLDKDGPFLSMHDGSGVLLGDVDETEIVTITKPTAPSVSSKAYICKPFDTPWLAIWAYDWVSWINGSGTRTTAQARAANLTITSVEYTENGMAIVAFLPKITYPTFAKGYVYQVRGPRYQFRFSQDTSGKGGPAAAISVPPYSSEVDPQVVNQPVPLFDSDGNLYANFSVLDYHGPLYDEDLYLTDYTYDLTGYSVPNGITGYTGAYVTFRCDLDYTQPRRRTYFYVQSMVDGSDREGPPSEISAEILVRPGERVTLSTPLETGYSKNKLYRAGTKSDTFILVADVDGATYTDKENKLEPTELPPFGNPPDTGANLEPGSRWHPAHFAVVYKGNTLYPSDYFRPHCYPEDWGVPFPGDIMGTAIVGNTIIVWTDDGYTYSVVGNNPESLSRYMLSRDAPLLDVKSVAQIGDTIYWATNDGIAASDGNGIEIVSSKHLSREQWADFSPSLIGMESADGALYIDNGTSKLRFSFKDDELHALTTYSSTTETSYTWESKEFLYDKPTLFRWVQLDIDGTATVTLTGDGVSQSVSVSAGDPVEFDSLSPARRWKVKFEGSGTVRKFEAFEQSSIAVQPGGVVLDGGNVKVWRNLRFKFPDRGVFAAMSMDCSDYASVTVNFKAGGTTYAQAVADGHAIRLSRDMPEAAMYEVDVITDAEVYQLVLVPLSEVPLQDSLSVPAGDSIPPWMHQRYVMQTPHDLVSAIVESESAVTMALYMDRETTSSKSVAATPGVEVDVGSDSIGAFEIDFGSDNHKVGLVSIFPALVRPLADGGQVVAHNGPNWRRIAYRFANRGRVAGVVFASDRDIKLNIEVDGAEKVVDAMLSGNKVYTVPLNVDLGAVWVFTAEEVA